MKVRLLTAACALILTMSAPHPAEAACADLPDHAALRAALQASVKASGGPGNGGLDNHMWATIVDRTGTVCAVAYSGNSFGDQWPGSRLISAQKANTANGYSLDGMALSTANLYSGAQPGGFLYAITVSNPVNTAVAYGGNPKDFGTANDPMAGKLIGGVNAFGGGLALYNGKGVQGGLGLSGDTSCADHNVAWRVRQALKLDKVPNGVGPNKTDGILYDITLGKSASGFGHPACGNKEQDVALALKAGK